MLYHKFQKFIALFILFETTVTTLFFAQNMNNTKNKFLKNIPLKVLVFLIYEKVHIVTLNVSVSRVSIVHRTVQLNCICLSLCHWYSNSMYVTIQLLQVSIRILNLFYILEVKWVMFDGIDVIAKKNSSDFDL